MRWDWDEMIPAISQMSFQTTPIRKVQFDLTCIVFDCMTTEKHLQKHSKQPLW